MVTSSDSPAADVFFQKSSEIRSARQSSRELMNLQRRAADWITAV
jgi:hypothetical protein